MTKPWQRRAKIKTSFSHWRAGLPKIRRKQPKVISAAGCQQQATQLGKHKQRFCEETWIERAGILQFCRTSLDNCHMKNILSLPFPHFSLLESFFKMAEKFTPSLFWCPYESPKCFQIANMIVTSSLLHHTSFGCLYVFAHPIVQNFKIYEQIVLHFGFSFDYTLLER